MPCNGAHLTRPALAGEDLLERKFSRLKAEAINCHRNSLLHCPQKAKADKLDSRSWTIRQLDCEQDLKS